MRNLSREIMNTRGHITEVTTSWEVGDEPPPIISEENSRKPISYQSVNSSKEINADLMNI